MVIICIWEMEFDAGICGFYSTIILLLHHYLEHYCAVSAVVASLFNMDVLPSALPKKELIYCGRNDAITADGRRAIVDVAAAQPSLICCNNFLSK